jgi:hypothetical protein
VGWQGEKMTNLNDGLYRLQVNRQTILSQSRDQLLSDAQRLIDLALSDSNWSGPEAPLDAYLYQANALALAAANSGMLSTAAEVYNSLIDYMKSRFNLGGERRPIGLLLVNLGIIYCSQGNIDMGIFYILEAAKDDSIIAGNSPDDSYALKHLFRTTLIDPMLANVLEAVNVIDPQLTQSDINDWFISLGHRRYALLAYMVAMQNNRRLLHQHPHEYNYWQIYSSIRNIAALFEVEIKLFAHRKSLYSALQSLYSQKTWWRAFEIRKKQVGEDRDSTVPPDTRLRSAFITLTSTPDSKFWKSLLITYISRNYTVHEMDSPNALTREELDQVLESVLYTMIAAADFS